MAFAAAGHPPEVPLTCDSGAEGGERRQRRGRWLKKFSWGFPTSRASPSSTLKTRDSARGVGAVARVLTGSPHSGNVESDASANFELNLADVSHSVSAEDQRRGGDAPRRSSHSSCEVMICGRPRVPGTEARTQLRASV